MTQLNTSTNNITQYIRLSQAVDITGLPTDTIKKLIKSGKIDGYKPTYKMYLVRLKSLLMYIESTKIKPITKGALLG